MDRSQRITLGVIALAFLAGGDVAAFLGLDPAWPGVVLRAGIILGAIWFAAPAFSRLSRRTAIGVGIVAAVIVIRPTLILWGLVAGLAALVLVGRSKD